MKEILRPVKILLISPYIGLIKLFEEAVSRRKNIELTAYEADTSDAVPLIQTLPVENYDIIISRGYTCDMIHQVCSRHVLDVGISIYDVLRTIRLAQNYNGRFAIVGFYSIIHYAIILKDILPYDFDIFIIETVEEIKEKLEQLKETGYTMIVGDVITTQTAKAIGLQTILITTSPESVDTTLDNSISLHKELLSLKKERDFYRELACGAAEGIAVYSQNAELVFSNRLEPEALKKILKKNVPVLFEKSEIRFAKTLETWQFMVHGRITSDGSMAVFYFKGTDRGKRGNHLIRFHDKEDIAISVSQRFFYTLSPALKAAQTEIQSFRFFSRPVLINGPFGSGKNSFAFLLYQNNNHQNSPLAVIDCSFAEGKDWDYLINHEDSPLYGTGYTIFFKDIHLLNQRQQNQLLTILRTTALNRRNQLIFSCILDSCSTFDENILRNEIVNTMQALTITIPALNDRREDIPNLATLYLSEFNAQIAKQTVAFEPEALQLLQEFNWTNNLYQMRSVIQELTLCSESSFITEKETRKVLAKISEEDASSQKNESLSLEGTLDEITKRIIRQVLKEENMNQSSAAKRLNIGRSTLRRHLL